MDFHNSVLLKELIERLKVLPDGKYIDATLGGGGHAKAIIDGGGIVLGIDKDEEALNFAKRILVREIAESKLIPAHGNFRNIEKIATENNFEKVMGIVFDLGVSSHQIDQAERGFSYLKEGPLDMRMDRGSQIKASDVINLTGRDELIRIFREFGEEKNAKKIVERIIENRKVKAILSTNELVDTIAKAYGIKNMTNKKRSEISKRVFQSLRIVVNDELDAIREGLSEAFNILLPQGKLAVISFHSAEDRIVKNAFKRFEVDGLGKIINDKPILPSDLEIYENSRSKSAKLRIFEKK